ncbi:N-acetylglucosamine-1-phosphodiester alpha-N-acetylglucosaminidase-like [Liolophura sinensis]|uniref:N-acetylglucosamine-1-phosphodiester alpha-N-acetylglucosaminidase-like n=1 Tax=Liolophura sinensis TaxID=3198878 RepID=UPI0031598274
MYLFSNALDMVTLRNAPRQLTFLVLWLNTVVNLCHGNGALHDADNTNRVRNEPLGSVEDPMEGMDILSPYKFHHGPRHGNRHIRECQKIKYGNSTYSFVAPHGLLSREITLPIANTKLVVKEVGEYWNKRRVHGHVTFVNNPVQTVAVLEPLHQGTCQKGGAERATVIKSAEQRNCLVAINAGFFNTKTGECLGNVVSDGRLVQDSGGIQNAHFGILKNGSLFFGYLSESFLLETDFLQLVGGVFWVIRDGESHLNESIYLECEDTEETGTLQTFADVNSARTVIGVDKDGRVIIVQMDGKTHSNGMTMWEMVDFLLTLGVVNAINLDGGGSATFVVNGTLANYPTDICKHDKEYRCARKVSTIVCVHQPDCSPVNCSDHGQCVLGQCECEEYWEGQACDRLICPHNCHDHGECTSGGCKCDKGWLGKTCDTSCPQGQYGLQCSERCKCEHGASCNSITGVCDCPPGYTGAHCDKECPYGYFGRQCIGECYCPNDCTCDPITGSCQYSLNKTSLLTAATCLMSQMIAERHLVVDQPEQYRLCLISIILISILAACSIVLNISLVCAQCVCSKRRRSRSKRVYRHAVSEESANEGDGEDSSGEKSQIEEESSFITRPPRSKLGSNKYDSIPLSDS